MKHIQTFEQFLNEAVSQEAYRIHSITQCGQDAAQDFIDDNNIDSEKLITYLKQNVNSPKKYDIRDLIKDPKSNKMLLKQFTNEKIEYPEGVKTTGDKILDKLAKLLNSSKGIIEVGSGSVRGKKIPFQTGDAYFNITSQSDTYVLLCSNGDFEFPKKEIKDAEVLFNQIEKAVQMGTVTIGNIKEDYSDKIDRVESNAALFIKNPALKKYITDNDQYGFAIMEVPVAKLEAAMKTKIKDILAMSEETLSISLDPTTKTVDIILDRVG